MIWLLILLSIVFVIVVFILGTYSAKLEATTKSDTSSCKTQTSCSGDLMGSASCSKASTASGTTGTCESAPAPVDEHEAPCKKHRKRHCHVCYKRHDDGFSTNGTIISTPAPF